MNEHRVDYYKKKAVEIVRRRNLCSYMNATKWNELRTAMLEEMPFPPAFIVKTLFQENVNRKPIFKMMLVIGVTGLRVWPFLTIIMVNLPLSG